MTHCFRVLSIATVAIVAALLFGTTMLRAQGTTVPIPGTWPTWGACYGGPPNVDALQFLFDGTASPPSCQIADAALRLSIGGAWTAPVFGQLGVVDSSRIYLSPTGHWFSGFAHDSSTVLRSSWGDLVLSATTSISGPTEGNAPPTASIRFGTTPYDSTDTTAEQPHDIERMVITGNGNVGIDVPPMADGLDSASDQIQIGGGVAPPSGYTTPIPGLTLYGGNAFEGTPKPGGGFYPVDYRYISFNHYQVHPSDTGGGRFAPVGASGLYFSDDDTNGMISLEAVPFWAGDSLNDWSGGMTLSVDGHEGLGFYCDERRFGGSQYDHLLDIFPPGVLPYGVTRNVSGLTYIRTPLCIMDSGNMTLTDFTNLNGIAPDIGDGKTWTLAVDGPALFKEAFVLDSTWADYVFDPNYELMPLDKAESFMKMNRHLPDLPPASALAKTGVPIGRTEEQLTKQLEEAMLYIGQLSDQNKELSTKLDKLEKAVEELKNQKEK